MPNTTADFVRFLLEYIFNGMANLLTTGTKAMFFIDISPGSEIWNNITAMHRSFIAPVGACLITLMFFYALSEKLNGEGLTLEVVGKMLCKYFLMIGFMEASLYLAAFLINLGNIVTSEASAYITNNMSGPDNNMVDNLMIFFFGSAHPAEPASFPDSLINDLKIIPIILILILPFLISVVCIAVIEIISFTRVLEVFTRATFMPVALGDCYNGLHSGAVRYIKSFLAVCLQGLVIIVIIFIGNLLMRDSVGFATSDSLDGMSKVVYAIIQPVMYMVAEVGLIVKSLPLAKEICGTH